MIDLTLLREAVNRTQEALEALERSQELLKAILNDAEGDRYREDYEENLR